MHWHPDLDNMVEPKLHKLLRNGHCQEVIELLETKEGPGSSKELDVTGGLPIHIAAVLGQMDVVKILIEKYPEGLKQKDQEGQLPIHFAAWHSKVLVKLLAENDPMGVQQPDNSGNLQTHIAARKGRVQMVKYLMERNPDGLMQLSFLARGKAKGVVSKPMT